MSEKKKNTIITLIAVYLGLCVFRLLIALITSNYPSTIPDEFLYYSLARSFATGKGALFYGQQANYSYFLYPLLLSPAYLLPDGTNFYRVMQAISIAVMNLSLFPLHALGNKILGDSKKSLMVAVLSLLLPDFILAQRLMSESLLYPLFFLMLWLISSGEVRKTALAGVVGGLLFAIKPGHIVSPVVFICAAAIPRMKSDRAAGKRLFIAGLLPLVLTSAALLLYTVFVLNPGTTMFSIYDQQIALGTELHIGAFLKGLALSPYSFVLAAGIFPVLIPIWNARKYSAEQHGLLFASLISVAALMLGTAWIVNRVEYTNNTVHTRYVAMFIPVFLMLLFAVPENLPEKKLHASEKKSSVFLRKGFFLFCILCVLPALLFGYDGGMDASANSVFNYALSWLHSLSGIYPKSIVLTGLVALLLVVSFTISGFWKGTAYARKAALLFSGLIFINTVCAYTYMARSYVLPESECENVVQLRKAIAGEPYLDVIGDSRTRYDALLDVNTKASRSIVYINDLFNHTMETGGVYEPFLPAELLGDSPDRLTEGAELILLDKDALTQVNLSDDTQIVAETSLLTLIRITPGKRWADSMLGGPVGRTLTKGTTAVFTNFCEEGSQTLTVEMTPATDTTLIVTGSSGSFSFDLPAGHDSYIFHINGEKTLAITADTDITIDSYSFSA